VPAPGDRLDVEAAPGRLALRGELTFASVERAGDVRAHLATAGQAGPVVADLSGITRVDSAGLALLVGVIGAARAAGVALTFRAVPPRLRAIARISEVEDLLVETAAA